MSDYGVFATYYDRLTQNVNYKGRAEYFRTLLCTYGICEGTLLDLACGTGKILYEMAALGYDTIGVDSSVDMLSLARNRAEYDKYSPLLLCQEMQELDLHGTVDCALSSLDSINHLLERDHVLKTFERVILFLNPGGVFVFDVNTPYKHEHVLADNSFVYDLDDLFCVWQNTYEAENHEVEMVLDFFTKTQGENYRRQTQVIWERAYELEDLKSMLKSAGFKPMGVFEDMTQEAPSATSQRVVFVAQKPS